MTPSPDLQLIAALRQRLAQVRTFSWEAEWPLHPDQHGASVLIAIVPEPQGASVLLTRRSDHLYHHPGQISFPGGRIESDDASPVQAALREAEEEIGLRADQIEVLGALPDYGTSSGFRITPVIALANPDFVPRLDAFEVAELFSVPLGFVLQTSNYQRHRVQRQDAIRHFFAVPYPGRFIWGATAGMLAMLAAFMAHDADALHHPSMPTDLGARPTSQAESGVYSG